MRIGDALSATVAIPVYCDRCKKPVGAYRGDGTFKVWVKDRSLFIRPDGTVDMQCQHCGETVILPMRTQS